MSYVDTMYIQQLEDIIDFGVKEEGNVRARWSDGTPAPTKRLFNIYCRHPNIADAFPILTCRPVDIKKAADEMIWIFQKKSTNIADLKLSHVWDKWADENGDVGHTYGYQAGKKYFWNEQLGYMDQVDRTLWMLKNDPMSRHIIINLWNPVDYYKMNLAPCCCWLQFNVWRNPDGDNVLDMALYERSWDLIAAGGWDVVAHALLQMMFAWATDMVPGDFTHYVSNVHIYDRHIKVARDIIEVYREQPREIKMADEPIVRVKPDTPHDFYAFTPDSFEFLTPYKPYGPQPKFEVAI